MKSILPLEYVYVDTVKYAYDNYDWDIVNWYFRGTGLKLSLSERMLCFDKNIWDMLKIERGNLVLEYHPKLFLSIDIIDGLDDPDLLFPEPRDLTAKDLKCVYEIMSMLYSFRYKKVTRLDKIRMRLFNLWKIVRR